MKGELSRVIELIDYEKLTVEDKFEILEIFKRTKNDLIRNQLALLLSEANFKEAVPVLLKKIIEKDLVNRNGTLVFALGPMLSQDYIAQIVKIICFQEYEARLMAFEIIKNIRPTLTGKSIKKALKILEMCKIKLEKDNTHYVENSTLHFIEETIAVLKNGATIPDSSCNKIVSRN